jgi:hypothetical protein
MPRGFKEEYRKLKNRNGIVYKVIAYAGIEGRPLAIKWTTTHSNQLHQLLASVSRHLYGKKNGLLKYQEKAFGVNQHVPALLLRERPIPFKVPDYYGLGNEDEAIIYAVNSRTSREQTPGALEWLRETNRAIER